MRTTFAAEPRSCAWQPGLHLKTYSAQPFPAIAWTQVPSSNAVKWCEAVYLTWIVKDESDAKDA
ncbi:hypothetical protein [Methyloceanibacter sp.]|uniref:hypothetical protein n=1 Tax=Methyloceanibacter sp. TaxID=1965321 RepID=UPI002D58C8DC|nr:hypothetical protein [Methyloceanibacter sp.]HZP08914.1 hypothetical protein [Methyloceanibacter sp.]